VISNSPHIVLIFYLLYSTLQIKILNPFFFSLNNPMTLWLHMSSPQTEAHTVKLKHKTHTHTHTHAHIHTSANNLEMHTLFRKRQLFPKHIPPPCEYLPYGRVGEEPGRACLCVCVCVCVRARAVAMNPDSMAHDSASLPATGKQARRRREKKPSSTTPSRPLTLIYAGSRFTVSKPVCGLLFAI